MVYGVILASGVGKRMHMDIPKQFIELEGVPLIIYTIRSMLKVDRIDWIYLAVHPDYLDYMQELLDKYFPGSAQAKMRIVAGGPERIDTITNVTNAIVADNTVTDNDVIILHDAVRPFVTKKILEDSIDGSLAHGATVASMPAVDTMLISEDGKKVDSIPVRSTIFSGQAPDSFRLTFFMKLRDRLTPEQRKAITGTSQFCTYNGEPIYLIPGDDLNFKITTAADLDRAKVALEIIEGGNK